MISEKLKLLSNFHDFYDHAFDLDGDVFDRRDNIGMSRQEMFRFFRDKGMPSVQNGMVEDVCPLLLSEFDESFGSVGYKESIEFLIPEVIIYTDENAHCGNGKTKVRCDTALKEYKGMYCSEFIFSFSTSFRLLNIGGMGFFLRYKSDHEWASNVGNVEIDILYTNLKLNDRINYPLYAVDYIHCNGYKAIDFNRSPKISGTGVEDLLKPNEIYELIKNKFI